MNYVSIALIALFTFNLMSCSPKEEHATQAQQTSQRESSTPTPSPTSENATPSSDSDLDAKIKAAVSISSDARAKIALRLKKLSAKLPSTDLIFDQYTDITDRNRDLSLLDDAGIKFWKDMVLDCHVDHGSPVGTTEFPGLNQPILSKVLKSIDGPNCLISYSEEEDKTTTVSQLDRATSNATFTSHAVNGSSMLILDSSLRTDSGLAKFTTVLTTDRQGENIPQVVITRPKDGHQVTITHGQSTFELADGGQGSDTLDTLRDWKADKDIGKGYVSLTFPEGKMSFGVVRNDQQVQYYVDGQAVSAEQFKNEFGTFLQL